MKTVACGGYLRVGPTLGVWRGPRCRSPLGRPPPGSCCSACPRRGGSAWLPRALPPGPGPAGPGEPAAAGSQTEDDTDRKR